MVQEIPDILTLKNKERFRRRLLISSRVIGVLLILSIFFVGYIQIKYVGKINSIKTEHGKLAYCYLCGLENGRSCSCNYQYDLMLGNNFDRKAYFENIANLNIEPCENRNTQEYKNPKLNFSS